LKLLVALPAEHCYTTTNNSTEPRLTADWNGRLSSPDAGWSRDPLWLSASAGLAALHRLQLVRNEKFTLEQFWHVQSVSLFVNGTFG